MKGSTIPVAVLTSIVAVLGIQEYLQIIFHNNEESISITIKIISNIVSMAIIISACLGSWDILFLILAINLISLSVFTLSQFAFNNAVFNIIAKQVFGIVYIPVSLSLLVFIKGFDNGSFWILWLLIVVFINDTGAFYVGTFFGGTFFKKRALAPLISPNKTIEGSIGGIFFSTIAGFIFSLIFFHDLSLALYIIPLSFILAIAGQIGDLFESAMKRAAKIKDSGWILPGHGGVLDRIDGLLFAIPVLYGFLVFVL